MTKDEMLELRSMMKEVVAEELAPVNVRLESLEAGQKSLEAEINGIKKDMDVMAEHMGAGFGIIGKQLSTLMEDVKTLKHQINDEARQREKDKAETLVLKCRLDDLEGRVIALEHPTPQ